MFSQKESRVVSQGCASAFFYAYFTRNLPARGDRFYMTERYFGYNKIGGHEYGRNDYFV